MSNKIEFYEEICSFFWNCVACHFWEEQTPSQRLSRGIISVANAPVAQRKVGYERARVHDDSLESESSENKIDFQFN